MRQLMALKAEGRIEEARQHGLLQLGLKPQDAELHYEVAGLHDQLGREQDAIPLYCKAIALGLGGDALRGALLGLGSSYRSLGQHEAALTALEQGLARFPQASEFKAFRAMVYYNQSRHKEACEALLGLLAQSTSDPALTPYKGAMALYSEDLDRRW